MSSQTFISKFDEELTNNGFEETEDGYDSSYVNPLIPVAVFSVIGVGVLAYFVLNESLQPIADIKLPDLSTPPPRKYTQQEPYTPTAPSPPLALDQASSADTWVSPVEHPRITSKFGFRTHPVTGEKMKAHKGIDIGCPVGTFVYAPASGTVTDYHFSSTGGNMLTVKHNKHYSTVYMHLSGLPSDITVGTKVVAGQVIALTGNTGRSTGPHLHYEIRRDGIAVDPTTVHRSDLEKDDPIPQLPPSGSHSSIVDSPYNRKNI